MGSVDALAKWLQEKPSGEGPANKVLQVRLDEYNGKALAYLARRFGMPRATLAQELLKAAIRDTLVATPGNVRELIWDDETETATPQLVHDFGNVRDDDDDGEGEVG